MGNKKMYCAYKSIVIVVVLLFGFSTIVFADPLTRLQVAAGEETQYTVGEVIIIDNDNQKESYTIDSINNNELLISKRFQNGVEMKIVSGQQEVYPVSWMSEFSSFPVFDSIQYLSVYSVGSPQYINDVNSQLDFASNNWSAPYFQSNYFFDGLILRIDTYYVGLESLAQYIKIYNLIDGNYVSINGGLVLNVVGNYGNVDIATNPILILAFVVVGALASIFVVKKFISLANKT